MRTRFGILVAIFAYDRVFREILLGDEHVLDMYLNQINSQSKDITYALRDSMRYWESQ